jgi:hypothetical protein
MVACFIGLRLRKADPSLAKPQRGKETKDKSKKFLKFFKPLRTLRLCERLYFQTHLSRCTNIVSKKAVMDYGRSGPSQTA